MVLLMGKSAVEVSSVKPEMKGLAGEWRSSFEISSSEILSYLGGIIYFSDNFP